MKKILGLLSVLGFLLIPLTTNALGLSAGVQDRQGGFGGARQSLEEVGEQVESDYRRRDIDIYTMIESGIQTALGVVGIILLVIIVYAGYIWFLAGGNEAKVAESKKWMINATVGLFIITFAWLITSFVLQSLQLRGTSG